MVDVEKEMMKEIMWQIIIQATRGKWRQQKSRF